ncbi:unnamed protein product, partial [Owenia fusiformis]
YFSVFGYTFICIFHFKAVCCSDGVHCCPSGTTCDVSAGKCNRGNSFTEWFTKLEAQPVESKTVICGGGASQCPDGSTCCKLSSGQYGCCPLPKVRYNLYLEINLIQTIPLIFLTTFIWLYFYIYFHFKAVCCSDGVHCCPSGTTCDVSAGKCNRGNSFTEWFTKVDAQAVESKTVICGGGASQCPDGSTCCKLSSGQYGCCPLPK